MGKNTILWAYVDRNYIYVARYNDPWLVIDMPQDAEFIINQDGGKELKYEDICRFQADNQNINSEFFSDDELMNELLETNLN